MKTYHISYDFREIFIRIVEMLGVQIFPVPLQTTKRRNSHVDTSTIILVTKKEEGIDFVYLIETISMTNISGPCFDQNTQE